MIKKTELNRFLGIFAVLLLSYQALTAGTPETKLGEGEYLLDLTEISWEYLSFDNDEQLSYEEITIRGFFSACPVATQVPIAHVIGKNDNDVRIAARFLLFAFTSLISGIENLPFSW